MLAGVIPDVGGHREDALQFALLIKTRLLGLLSVLAAVSTAHVSGMMFYLFILVKLEYLCDY